MMLATLDFNVAKDEDGKDIACEPTFTNGLTQSVLIARSIYSLLIFFFKSPGQIPLPTHPSRTRC